MGKWLGVAAAAAMVTGCNFGAREFQCGPDKTCGSGTCEPGFNFCSFPDGSCMSGRRFGELAGDLSNTCVGGEPPTIDGGVDIPVPPDGRACFGGPFLTVCLLSAPTAPLMISGSTPTVDTDPGAASSMCVTIDTARSTPGDYCVLAGTTISVQGTLRAIGPRPLVLVATDSITVSSLIDVGSHRGVIAAGAGANPAACGAGMAPGASGGGAGGTFAGIGGLGGDDTSAGLGGMPAPVVPITALRGGCAGQDGEGAAPAAAKGKGGRGGGAVYLIAGRAIDVAGSGVINAAGEGGGGGTTADSGAGGGGSGGMIGFDAPAITGSGLLLASGGGGGEGADNSTIGFDGADPMNANAALGGAHGGSGAGGNGGNGSSRVAASAGMAGFGSTNNGGGGGGGGAGVIKAPASANLGTQNSPPPTL